MTAALDYFLLFFYYEVNMTNNMSVLDPDNKKPYFLLVTTGILIFFVLALSMVIIFLNGKRSKNQATDLDSIANIIKNQSSARPSQTAENKEIPVYPEVKVSSWNIGSKKPAGLPSDVKIYPLKTSFSDSDLVSLSKKLLTEGQIYVQKANILTVAYTTNENKKQISTVFFNPYSGVFSYGSNTGIPLSSLSVDTGAESILKNVLTEDLALSLTASYRRKDQPDLRYFEFHRDWKKMGLPVFNLLGLFNLPDDQPLSSLTLTGNIANLPSDINIYATTDSKDGLGRQTDFNSATVAVDEKKKTVLAINSNLRPIDMGKIVSQSIISYEQAVTKLKNNQYQSLVTRPSGKGTPDYNKVYPGDKGLAKTAVVTDAVLAYLESPANVVQKIIEPFYVFKGYATLDSGYRVDLLATVRAVSENKNQAGRRPDAVLGESTVSTPPAQQQSTINFPTKVPKATNCPPGIGGVGTFPVSQLVNVRQISSVKVGDGTPPATNETYLYYVPEGQIDINSLIGTLRSLGLFGRDDAERFTKDYLAALESPDCAVRMTGGSPSVFIYGSNGEKVEVSVGTTGVIYSDPSITGDRWSAKIANDGQLVTDYGKIDYLYYEYRPVGFTRPEHGWIVSRDSLDQFVVKNIAPKLGLTRRETERAIFELKHAAYYLQDEELFVGLVGDNELNDKLPLKTSSNIKNVYRYHFYVASVNDDKPVPPVLKKINRENVYLLEIGGSGSNRI